MRIKISAKEKGLPGLVKFLSTLDNFFIVNKDLLGHYPSSFAKNVSIEFINDIRVTFSHDSATFALYKIKPIKNKVGEIYAYAFRGKRYGNGYFKFNWGVEIKILISYLKSLISQKSFFILFQWYEIESNFIGGDYGYGGSLPGYEIVFNGHDSNVKEFNITVSKENGEIIKKWLTRNPKHLRFTLEILYGHSEICFDLLLENDRYVLSYACEPSEFDSTVGFLESLSLFMKRRGYVIKKFYRLF